VPERVRVQGDLFHGVVPAGAIYVGRGAPGLPASRYANPFAVKRGLGRGHRLRPYLDDALAQECARGGPRDGRPDPRKPLDLRKPLYDVLAPGTPAVAVAAYRLYLADRPDLIASTRAELAGRDLACWCSLPDEPGEPDVCHGAILLRIAACELP